MTALAISTIAALFSQALYAPSLKAATNDRPNVVLILADDLGYGDVSTYRVGEVHTKHLDKLARDGMTFSNMRANATVCSPSRAALLTGMYADRVGVPGVIRTQPADSWGYLDPQAITLADHFRKAHYHTAMIGKWHLGLASPNTPNERGFDHFHGFLGDMMDSYTTHLRHGNNYMRLNANPVNPEGHATEIFADWAIEYLSQRAEQPQQPFFLYLAWNAPHFPIEPPDDWLQKTRKRFPDLEEKRIRNIALVEHMDHHLGRVLEALEQLGMDKNTFVAFSSDNGGSLPHAQNNYPWRDGKQSHYDGGLKVPFVVRWPDQIPAGSRSDYQGLLFDLFPTALEIATGEVPNNLDAVSLTPLFRGEVMEQARDLYFVRREGGPAYGGKSYEAIVRGPWKLMQNSPYRPLELYHLGDDPAEERDLIDTNPPILNALRESLRKQIQRGGVVPWQP